VRVHEIATDLVLEQESLDSVVASIGTAAWGTDTPSPRWDITDQIAHLTYFDHAAATAITDPDRFRNMVDDLMGAAAGGILAVDEFTLGRYRSMGVKELLAEWRGGRSRQNEAATTLTDDTRVIWYGPSMGARSFLTARLMEVWAHGQDIVDALGAERPATDRLRHIAQLGVITRAWTYINRKLDPPESEVDVVLSAPSGAEWTWGPGDATDTVTGNALDFCLVVTQRRHVGDTGLVLVGDTTHEWLTMAQVFAGPPTDGPGQGSI
jgi:uncharacterized protein (TIGR03084 family)